MKKKNLIIFGPGPEAIKMAPLVNQFLGDARFETRVCLIGYAQDFRDQVLAFFKITPTYDLSFIQSNQSLYSLTGDIIDGGSANYRTGHLCDVYHQWRREVFYFY